MSLFISFRSEILKTRRTVTFYLTLITAALIPFIFLMDVVSDGISPESRANVLNELIKEAFAGLCIVVLPMFVLLSTTLLPQIEYRNNTWKQVFASPQTMGSIYFARFLNIQLLLLFFMLLFNIFLGLLMVAIHFIEPSLNLLSMPFNGMTLLNNNINTYVAVLGLSTLQFWIGLRLRNFILPIAIGFALWMVGAMMVFEFDSTLANYFPYSYLILSMYPKFKPVLPTILWSSVGFMLLFLGLGFLDFQRSRTK